MGKKHTLADLERIVGEQAAALKASKVAEKLAADAKAESDAETRQARQDAQQGGTGGGVPKRPLNFVGEQTPYWRTPSKLYAVAALHAAKGGEYATEFHILAAIGAAQLDALEGISNTLRKQAGRNTGSADSEDAAAMLLKAAGLS